MQDDPRLEAARKGGAKLIKELVPDLLQSPIHGASTGIKLLASTFQILQQGIKDKKEQDLDSFLMELARRAQDDGIDFNREFLEQGFAEAHTQEVLTQAVRAALEITNGRLLGILAHITYHYRVNEKPPDLFFRAFVEFLKRIGGMELEQLEAFLKACLELSRARDRAPFSRFEVMIEDGPMFCPSVSVPGTGTLVCKVDVPTPRAFWDVLVGLGLASVNSGLGGGTQAWVYTDFVREMARFVLGENPGPLGLAPSTDEEQK